MYVLFVVIFRYSAVRRQFGPPGKDEIPVLEYQMQVGFLLDMWSIIYTKNCYFNDSHATQFLSRTTRIVQCMTQFSSHRQQDVTGNLLLRGTVQRG